MAADPSRVVDVQGIFPPDDRGDVYTNLGSGLLVTSDLVLTAAHVVFDGAVPLKVKVRLYEREQVWGVVVWPTTGDEIDAALVRLEHPQTPFPGAGPLSWARYTGRSGQQRVEASGYPKVMIDSDQRISYQIGGHINPQGDRHRGRYLVSVDEPPRDQGDPWAGMSGAVLTPAKSEAVVGVIVIDTPGFKRDLLTAIPASSITKHHEARRLLGLHGALPSIELSRILSQPLKKSGALSPAQLLRAEEGVIDFQGRDEQLQLLTNWCLSDVVFDARLIVGPGGRGKTRLAHELITRLTAAAPEYWIAGMLAPGARGDELKMVLDTASEHAILLVADYAESRVEQISELLTEVARVRDHAKLRLLMLARDKGDWWTQLSDRHREMLDSDAFTVLAPLHDSQDRTSAFRSCLVQFAARLDEGDPTGSWVAALDKVPTPALEGVRFGDPLSLQLAALLGLLEAGDNSQSGPEQPKPIEERLLQREREYWRAGLRALELKISERNSRQAVAVATLIGVRDRAAAVTLLQRVPELSEPGRIADWLRSLYPTETESRFWGALQPDRLGEHHVGLVAKDDPELLGHLLSSEDENELQDALIVLGRAISHQPHLSHQLEDVVENAGSALVAAIKGAAKRVADPLPLQRILSRVEVVPRYTVDPEVFGDLSPLWGHHASTPERLYEVGRGIGGNPFSSSQAYYEPSSPSEFSEDLMGPLDWEPAHVVVGRQHEKAATVAYERGNLVLAEQEFKRSRMRYAEQGTPSTHQTRVDMGLVAVLNDQRKYDAALALVDQVVSDCRSLLERELIPADVVARALDLQAGVMAEVDQISTAISISYEALEILRARSGKSESQSKARDLARTESNLASLLSRSGRVDEAALLAESAVDTLANLHARGALAPSDDSYGRALLVLARAKVAHAQLDQGSDLVERAAKEFEQISELEGAVATGIVPQLASTAELQCGLAAERGRISEALAFGQKARYAYERLVDTRPPFSMDLARVNIMISEILVKNGHPAKAIEAVQRARALLTQDFSSATHTDSNERRRVERLRDRAQLVEHQARSQVWK